MHFKTAACVAALLSVVILMGIAHAAPIETLDRNGAWIAAKAYRPNVVHVTIAADEREALKGSGYGILADHADNGAFPQISDKEGDTFTSSASAGANWFNYRTNEKLTGGQRIKVNSPVDQITLFAKAGSILPIGSDIPSTATKQTIPQIKIYPVTDADFALYDDGGTRYDYENGRGATTSTLRWNETTQGLTATGPDKGFDKSVPGLVQVIGIR